MAGFCVGVGGNVNLIGETETSLGFGSVKSQAGSAARSGVQQECGRRSEKERGAESEKDMGFRHWRILLASSIERAAESLHVKLWIRTQLWMQ
jgi:hypothetical protein